MSKKRLVVLALLCSMIFTLTACTNEAGEKESKSNSPIIQSDTGRTSEKESESVNFSLNKNQTLNVAMLAAKDYYAIGIDTRSKINAAMKKIYPDYKLNVVAFYDVASYHSSIEESMKSGKLYDLIFADKDLQVDKFIEGEYLKDIYELIENDNDVSIDDYYLNALRAFEQNERLYRMPVSFVYDYLIGINTEVFPESIVDYNRFDSININSMIDIFKKNNNNYHGIINNMPHLDLIEPSMATYINFENMTCDFNNDRYKQFLIDIKDSMFSGGYENYYENFKTLGVYGEAFQTFFTQADDIFSSSKSMFTPRPSIDMDQAFIEYAVPYFEHFVPLTNENNELIISSNMVYCIGNTANAEMAWDFLKTYIDINGKRLDYGDMRLTSTLIPIKKEFFESRTNFFMGDAFERNIGKSYNGYGGDLKYDLETTINLAIEKLEKLNNMPMAVVRKIDTDGTLYKDTIDNFMKGIITVDQAAQQIQNAMSLYLSE